MTPDGIISLKYVGGEINGFVFRYSNAITSFKSLPEEGLTDKSFYTELIFWYKIRSHTSHRRYII